MKILNTLLGTFCVPDQGVITRALEAGQWWDRHLKPLIDRAEPGVALDLGAHVGWFSVYLAQLGYSVLALEPHPTTFGMLQENLLRNRTRLSVTAWPLAAYDQTVQLGLDVQNDLSDVGGYSYTDRCYGTGLQVVGVALDDYCPPDRTVTLIKSDCQGADLRALKGLERTIRRCRPLIVFEWEETMAGWHGDSWEDYLKFFDGLHYQVERITIDFWDYCARPL